MRSNPVKPVSSATQSASHSLEKKSPTTNLTSPGLVTEYFSRLVSSEKLYPERAANSVAAYARAVSTPIGDTSRPYTSYPWSASMTTSYPFPQPWDKVKSVNDQTFLHGNGIHTGTRALSLRPPAWLGRGIKLESDSSRSMSAGEGFPRSQRSCSAVSHSADHPSAWFWRSLESKSVTTGIEMGWVSNISYSPARKVRDEPTGDKWGCPRLVVAVGCHGFRLQDVSSCCLVWL